MNKGALCQALGWVWMAGEEAWSVWEGRDGGVQSGTGMNVPSVPSDIAPPCLLSQRC